MKVSVDHKALAAALSAASRIAMKGDKIPILSTVFIRAEDNRISIVSDNRDMRLMASVPADVEQSGAIAVAAQLLNDIVRRCRPTAVTLDASDKAVAIRAGSAKFSLAIIDASAFPDWPTPAWVTSLTIPAADLSRALLACRGCTYSGADMAYLDGVCFAPLAGSIDLVSSNGNSLVLFRVETGSHLSDPFIVPSSAVDEVAKLATSGDVVVEAGQGTARFTLASGAQLITKLVEGVFPDYARILPTEIPLTVIADRESLSDSLARVAVVAGGREKTTRFSFSPAGSRVSVKYFDQGIPREAEDDVEAEADTEFEIGLNASYVQNALSAVASETVEIRLRDPMKAAVFAPAGKSSPLCLISPLRI